MINKHRVCVVTFPVSQSGVIPLSNFVNILKKLSNNISVISSDVFLRNYVICKDNIRIYPVTHAKGRTSLERIKNYLVTQIKISIKILKLRRKFDICIFFIGGDGLIVPCIVCKLLNKKTILYFAGSMIQTARNKNDALVGFLKLLSSINKRTCDRIILYSPNLIKEWNLEKYKDKILIAHEHFLDFSKFKVKKKLSERNDLVGYIGRLSEEKGVLNFVKAIPEILKERDDLEFLICGDGELRDEIEKYVSENNLNDKVKLAGWIPHEKLPDYLNELKLVVLPSFTEGLPNIMLEAMACGTPVLATPVGAISDVIKDEETGFIMKDNSPECIARNVIRALNHSNLEQVAQNARALVEKEFTFEKAVERYRKILDDL